MAEAEAANRAAIKDLIQSGITGAQLGAANDFRFMIALHPTWWQVHVGHVPELIAVAQGLKDSGVDCADLLPFFNEAIPRPIPGDCYWQYDKHYTAKGYEVFAKAVYAEIQRRGILRRKAE